LERRITAARLERKSFTQRSEVKRLGAEGGLLPKYLKLKDNVLNRMSTDAMQGWGEMIPTQKKIDYINRLMEVRFDVLDCGSFVNPKTMPQMADSGIVVDEIDKSLSNTNSLWLLRIYVVLKKL
jgi:hypothetical protein